MKRVKKDNVYDGLFFIVGTVLYSLAVNSFLIPAEILPGGLTGIAAAIARITALPKGTLLLILNLPVLYMGFRELGYRFIVKTAVVTALLSVSLDVLNINAFVFKGEKMLSALAGGVLLGGGIGIIMLRGATTGGVDIIAKLVNNKKPSFTLGRVILMGDIISIALSGLVFADISSVLYSLIAVYAASRVTDLILYGSGGGKTVFAVTEKGSETAKAVFEKAHRGVTLLTAQGGYTKKGKTALYCVCRRDEINKVVSAVKETDAAAFITVCDAGDVIGEGFKK